MHKKVTLLRTFVRRYFLLLYVRTSNIIPRYLLRSSQAIPICFCCCFFFFCCYCSFETPPRKRIPRIFALYNSVPGKSIPKLPRESAMAVQFSSPESRLRSLAERQTVAISQLIKADSGRSFLARAERVSRSLRRRSRPISIR